MTKIKISEISKINYFQKLTLKILNFGQNQIVTRSKIKFFQKFDPKNPPNLTKIAAKSNPKINEIPKFLTKILVFETWHGLVWFLRKPHDWKINLVKPKILPFFQNKSLICGNFSLENLKGKNLRFEANTFFGFFRQNFGSKVCLELLKNAVIFTFE